MSYLRKQFKKEFLVYSRKSTFFITPMVFFLISISLYPIGISNDPEILKNLAPGLIWITILLSTLLCFYFILLRGVYAAPMTLSNSFRALGRDASCMNSSKRGDDFSKPRRKDD